MDTKGNAHETCLVGSHKLVRLSAFQVDYMGDCWRATPTDVHVRGRPSGCVLIFQGFAPNIDGAVAAMMGLLEAFAAGLEHQATEPRS